MSLQHQQLQLILIMCSTKSEAQIPSPPTGDDAKKKCSGKCKNCREKRKRESLIKTISVMSLVLISNFSLYAENTTPTQQGFWNDPFNHPMLSVYLITSLIFVVLLLIAFVAVYLMRVVNLLVTQTEQEKASRLGIIYVPKQTWWSKITQQMNASVPVEEEKSIELDHNYDGIKELDNHLPPWWKWLFYGTIGWSAVYLIVFHVFGSLPLQTQEYQDELTFAEEQAIKFKASQPQEAIDETTLVFLTDAIILSNGKKIYTTNCIACHKSDGGGNAIGPNLTDEYWLHGGSIKNIFSTIKSGVVEKGMPAWGRNMSPKDVRDVAFYVMSLQGSKPTDGKAPQGESYKPATAASDSTNVQASL
jgi:cytochrome c oxidase cbb3-type subunit 3